MIIIAACSGMRYVLPLRLTLCSRWYSLRIRRSHLVARDVIIHGREQILVGINLPFQPWKEARLGGVPPANMVCSLV